MSSPSLVLGPLMRYVDETSASIWVETGHSATVTVRAADRSFEARTFSVHGHHFALVEVQGLEPGSKTPYTVEVNSRQVWPPQADEADRADGEEAAEGSGRSHHPELPPSVIATLRPGKPLRLTYGSCRTSVTHDEKGNRSHGVDALRALSLRMATDPDVRWPDLVLFLGDQVYADETSEAMQDFIASRRDIEEPPGKELKDFEEYAHLYELAWTDPANRWLLSTLPSAMIFDDHDVRDDWNTSLAWKHKMDATRWWHERVVAGLSSYWVYQHIGNLSPEERGKDEIWRQVLDHEGADELDLTAELDALAARVDTDPECYRWSYARDIADVRLVVIDSRCARVLDPERRALLDPLELQWLDEQMRGGFRHLLLGTSLPYLLPPGLHHLEAWNEAVAGGAWGPRFQRIGEWMRQTVDLEHWGAWQRSFQRVGEMALEVADGRRGPAPRTVTFLSGDVHHSYVSEVRRRGARTIRGRQGARIVQAVCSPIRNPLPRAMRYLTALLAYAIAGPMGRLASRSAQVPKAPFTWRKLAGPWFDNMIATLEDSDEGLLLRWEKGVVDDDPFAPRLETVEEVLIRSR
ncbi:alkaline phosphatase D family protein [Nocardioides mesophilus]|uniref:Alkaline phosphatase family protein n=1 Tax=Nocardioides mesophilus TaxID=433659 RepID=A0A7G9REV5_9ACTN|nr:alkaline phosphatase D family protein [Nocardioides mesophilus]QNN54130.1 alkaline phosphatase family protein [Nocardioides mesophilus]